LLQSNNYFAWSIEICVTPSNLPPAMSDSILQELKCCADSGRCMPVTSWFQVAPLHRSRERKPGSVNVERNSMSANQKGGSKQSVRQDGVQGGTPEQHAEAGRQSHKNDASRQSGGAGSGGPATGGASGGRSGSSGSASGTRGGTPEQHTEAGRQSHKNDGKK
jgi:hypothetical protein